MTKTGHRVKTWGFNTALFALACLALSVGTFAQDAAPVDSASWWQQLLGPIMVALAGAVAWFIRKLVAAADAWFVEKGKASRTFRYLHKIEAVAADAVLAVVAESEASVKAAFADGKLSDVELAQIKSKAANAARESLGDSWGDLKERFHLDDNQMFKWLESKVAGLLVRK